MGPWNLDRGSPEGGCCLWSLARALSASGSHGSPPHSWQLSWLPRLVDFDGSLGWGGGSFLLSSSFPSWSGDTGCLPAGISGSSSGLPGSSAKERWEPGLYYLENLSLNLNSTWCTIVVGSHTVSEKPQDRQSLPGVISAIPLPSDKVAFH